ncbi:MAG: 30S ribosomal protein S12 methylthiotransferase RimO [Hyphomicrobiales bacterium]
MKTKSAKKKINIVTLGCSKNLVDSEALMGQLRRNNIEVVHEKDKGANIVVINTCGFINDAKEESIETILNYVEAKKSGLVEKVYVMGCLSERYKNDLQNEIKEVDGFYGVGAMDTILNDLGADYRAELIGERVVTTPKHYAYLKVSEGCDRRCSFCAIPLIRGKHISRSIEDLVAEARNLADEGVKELILIAQDLTYYGIDLYNERKLADLLRELCSIDSIEWIRLHYTYPAGFPEDVLDVMRDNSKICNYIDIPLQHIDEGLLRSMKRGASEDTTRGLIAKFREKVPNVAIRTTFIVGYPGETQEAFESLKDFISESKFDRLGVFQYSPEEGTDAFKLDDDISDEVKEARASELMEVQQDISLSLNEKKVGHNFKVIIDREEQEYYVGRTEFDSPEVDNEVLIDKNTELSIGSFYEVEVYRADLFDLFAKII